MTPKSIGLSAWPHGNAVAMLSSFCVGFAHTKLSSTLDDFLNFLHRDHSVVATGVLMITKNNRWFIMIPPPCEIICLSLSGQSP